MSETKPRSRLRRFVGGFWFNLIAAFVVLALVQAFLVKLYYVPSASMEQTLEVGDRVLVSRTDLWFGEPRTGDVIVFNASSAWDKEGPPTPSNPLSYALRWLGGVVGIGPNLDHTLVKRVIAAPGQSVRCCSVDGKVVVDGKTLDEPYVFQDLPFVAGSLDCTSVPASLRCFDEVVVPDDRFFVLGDHRSDSNDSIAGCRGQSVTAACLKLVASADIVGRAFAVVLPPGRWRGI